VTVHDLSLIKYQVALGFEFVLLAAEFSIAAAGTQGG
jgi:hypothetical protein